jgi:hypothetical protein
VRIRGMHRGYWWERQKERDHQEDKEVGGWIILKWILESYNGVVWTGFLWFRIRTSRVLL